MDDVLPVKAPRLEAILEAKNPPGTEMIWIYIPPRMPVATKGLGWDPTKNVMSS